MALPGPALAVPVGRAVGSLGPALSPIFGQLAGGIGSGLGSALAGGGSSPGIATSEALTVANPISEGNVIVTNSSIFNSGSVLDPFIQGSEANGGVRSTAVSRLVSGALGLDAEGNAPAPRSNMTLLLLVAAGAGAFFLLR
jgi:hypothetical protein